jgi:hypothetical protein
MYEGKFSRTGGAYPLDPAESGPEELRAVSWSDLVARLEAARELRHELAGGEAGGDASFDPDSARHIAALGDGKLDVNLDDLVNGKAAGANSRLDNDGTASDEPRK